MSQNSETGTRPLTHNIHFEITLAQGELSQNPPAAEPTVMDVDLHLLLGVCSVPQSVSDGMRPSDA